MKEKIQDLRNHRSKKQNLMRNLNKKQKNMDRGCLTKNQISKIIMLKVEHLTKIRNKDQNDDE